jgi:hypothetical protein
MGNRWGINVDSVWIDIQENKNQKRATPVALFLCAGLDSNQRSPKGDRFTVCCD